MRLLDRYVLKCFLLPFVYCYLGIVAIWLILDMGDKLPNLIEAHASAGQMIHYYRIQMPQITVFCLPVSLLLATLYCLSRMSRSNEIVSMVTAGVSIVRILLPLFGAGLVFSLLTLALNYQLAPESESKRKVMFDELTANKRKSTDELGVLFRDRQGLRTWYFERMGTIGDESRDVQILQQNEQGDPLWKVYAKRVTYDPATRVWTFTSGEFVTVQPDGKIITVESFNVRYFNNFDETPWRIASADLKAEDMGVPLLRQYLSLNDDFPQPLLAPFRTHLAYRWAMPWQCLVVMIIAGSLGIVFSRRGVLGSVANAILLYFGLIFADKFLLSLAKGYRIPAELATWTPVLLFGAVGLLVLQVRTSGWNLNPFKR